MLDAREIELPYLDRKIALLKIMALIEPDNAGLWREIGRTLMEKGSRLEAAHLAVQSWYDAEQFMARALKLEADDLHTRYQYGEIHYMLGHYDQALTLWESLLTGCDETERKRIEARITAIRAGELPKVPPLDYLTALSVAFEQYQDDDVLEAAAIVEDVLADPVFCAQFPLAEVYRFLEQCHQKLNGRPGAPQGRC
jgi:tetratricopeptide (TPR) repeat protein